MRQGSILDKASFPSGEGGLVAHVVGLSARHGAAAAELHRQCIDSGFLSSLGLTFLKNLYRAISACPAGFGYAWEDPQGRALGFIACAESTGKVFKQVLIRRGLPVALPLIRFLTRPSVVWRMVQTLRYPAQVSPDVPAAEILSIAIRRQARRRGIATALLGAAMEEFARRGIDRVKVAVGAGNEPANRFYRRCGFELALTRTHHGLPQNIYVARIGADGAIAAANRSDQTARPTQHP